MPSRRRPSVLISMLLLAALACSQAPSSLITPVPLPLPVQPSLEVTVTTAAVDVVLPSPTSPADVTEPAATSLAAAGPSSTSPPTAEPVPTEPAVETYIAYAQNNALLVTHVLGGQALDTRQVAEGLPNEFILDLTWSPSGEFVSYVKLISLFPHQFYVNVLDGSAPVDLGIAQEDGAAWSLDSQQLVYVHEYELWVHSVEDGQSRRLTTHLGANWLWASPVFTPAGDAVVGAGFVGDQMDRNGNAPFKLYRVPLDGSADNAYPPAGMASLTDEIFGRQQLTLSFSPDGQKLALGTWSLVDGCARSAAYFVGNADGSDMRPLPVPSLAALGGLEQKLYFFGDSLVWTPESDGLWVKGLMKDCGKLFRIVGGPQISRVTLDGQEHEIIPGDFGEHTYGQISLDRTGTLLGVMHTVGYASHVQILGRDGRLVLDLGEGEVAALQP